MTKTDTRSAWLSPEELRDARDRLPIVYVDLVPVRVDERSVVTSVGLLLRASQDGEIRRELVSGRVLYHERIRDAIIRHIEKDLGPVSLPQVPLSPQPFTIAEYFPTPLASTRSRSPSSSSSWATARRSRTPSTWPGSPRRRPARSP